LDTGLPTLFSAIDTPSTMSVWTNNEVDG
jgi:hypothetical protein